MAPLKPEADGGKESFEKARLSRLKKVFERKVNADMETPRLGQFGNKKFFEQWKTLEKKTRGPISAEDLKKFLKEAQRLVDVKLAADKFVPLAEYHTALETSETNRQKERHAAAGLKGAFPTLPPAWEHMTGAELTALSKDILPSPEYGVWTKARETLIGSQEKLRDVTARLREESGGKFDSLLKENYDLTEQQMDLEYLENGGKDTAAGANEEWKQTWSDLIDERLLQGVEKVEAAGLSLLGEGALAPKEAGAEVPPAETTPTLTETPPVERREGADADVARAAAERIGPLVGLIEDPVTREAVQKKLNARAEKAMKDAEALPTGEKLEALRLAAKKAAEAFLADEHSPERLGELYDVLKAYDNVVDGEHMKPLATFILAESGETLDISGIGKKGEGGEGSEEGAGAAGAGGKKKDEGKGEGDGADKVEKRGSPERELELKREVDGLWVQVTDLRAEIRAVQRRNRVSSADEFLTRKLAAGIGELYVKMKPLSRELKADYDVEWPWTLDEKLIALDQIGARPGILNSKEDQALMEAIEKMPREALEKELETARKMQEAIEVKKKTLAAGAPPAGGKGPGEAAPESEAAKVSRERAEQAALSLGKMFGKRPEGILGMKGKSNFIEVMKDLAREPRPEVAAQVIANSVLDFGEDKDAILPRKKTELAKLIEGQLVQPFKKSDGATLEDRIYKRLREVVKNLPKTLGSMNKDVAWISKETINGAKKLKGYL